jgi:hypothetical protein
MCVTAAWSAMEAVLSKEANINIIEQEKGISLGGLCAVWLKGRAERLVFLGVKYGSDAGVAKW